MRPKTYFFTTILKTLIIVLLLLSIAGCIPPDTAAQKEPTAGVQEASLGGAGNSNATPSATQEPATPQVTLTPDGLSLLESRCTQCHLPQLLLATKKTRTGWEKTLAKMEGAGVRLDEAEKSVLLDYLVSLGEQ